MHVKVGQIEVFISGWDRSARRRSVRSKGNKMGGPGKRPELPETEDGEPKKPPPAPIKDDDVEDGDFATPKRDRCGEDDEPL
jgi:hypothetical protein